MIEITLLDIPPLYYTQKLHMIVTIKDNQYENYVEMQKDISNKDVGKCLAVLLDWKDLIEKELNEKTNNS